MQDTFKCTPEILCEFFDSLPRDSDARNFFQQWDNFKSSKSPKKEWEIVAFGEHFRGRVLLYKLQESGFYRNIDDDCTIEYADHQFKNDNEFIHSVRRLSDQAVFTKNEVVGTPSDGQHHIGGFEVRGNCLYAQFSVGQISIEHLQKLPQPILVTSDRVEIFEDRVVTVVYLKDHSYSIGPLSGYHPEILDGNKVFADDRKAQQYILENKPLLSLNDVKEQSRPNYGETIDISKLIERLTLLVTLKLNQ